MTSHAIAQSSPANIDRHAGGTPNAAADGEPPPAATYTVLSSGPALGSSSAINHAQLLRPNTDAASRGAESFMRFTGPTGGDKSSAPSGLSNYQASQAAHAAHLAEIDRQERETRAREREERRIAAGGGIERERENSRGMHQRKHSVSVSSKSHRTDMNGHVYNSQPDLFPAAAGGEGAPQPPPLASLHRSPSFDKRLIDSARFAGQELEEEEELNQFTCAGVCAGSCCAPTSSNGSSGYIMPTVNANGETLSPSELAAARQKYNENHHQSRGWYCHKPTPVFIGKVLAVLLVIAAGVIISVVLFQYLRHRELNTFRNQMDLLCLERSNTIQSQLNFSTTVMASNLGMFGLAKGNTATGLQPYATTAFFEQYANVSQTLDYLNFLIYSSWVTTNDDAVAWETNHPTLPGITWSEYTQRIDMNVESSVPHEHAGRGDAAAQR